MDFFERWRARILPQGPFLTVVEFEATILRLSFDVRAPEATRDHTTTITITGVDGTEVRDALGDSRTAEWLATRAPRYQSLGDPPDLGALEVVEVAPHAVRFVGDWGSLHVWGAALRGTAMDAG